MSWKFGVAVAASVLAGCSQADPLVLEHRSVLAYETRGLALDHDGDSGHAGMFVTTCDFRTAKGTVGTDYDFAGEDDTVTDGADDPSLGFSSVVVSAGGVHVVHPDDGEWIDVPVEGVVDGVLVEGGAVVVAQQGGTCGASWWHLGDTVAVPGGSYELPDEACDPDPEVESDHAATVFVATDDGVLVLTEDGWAKIDVVADHLAWDPWSEALYAAMDGKPLVRAVEVDGAVRWETEVAGGVTALDDLGEAAGASVTVASSDGTGALILLDGATGEVRADLATPSPARGLVVAGDGRTIGLVSKAETHFYDILPAAR